MSVKFIKSQSQKRFHRYMDTKGSFNVQHQEHHSNCLLKVFLFNCICAHYRKLVIITAHKLHTLRIINHNNLCVQKITKERITLYGKLCLVTKLRLTLLTPQGLQSARLLCPWGFSGKNIGVGCLFFFFFFFLRKAIAIQIPKYPIKKIIHTGTV